ncbi:peptidoglycan DD-metalloendopeptidase family protein [Nitrosomonas cryotolerans]|uniref:Lipoprotein NlpD n=1 Tax=Nitrosomonas cryotolerans ATCC 49181 TaxID=1131553 RepID=A0A1N6IGX9_9PROT|nr:peptidoglycan DD-metalloendopeptidase family protein [Nitrosomonas cryotolerans]SIO31294.1 lipoprotein NlpD [Nitrosomonas cryotolerans ATCC 49181]
MKDNIIGLVKLSLDKSIVMTFTYLYSRSRLLSSVHFLLLVIFCCLLVSCGSTSRPAPIVDRALIDSSQPLGKATGTDATKAQFYTVRKGDTFYSIALNHGIDYKELAEWNGIADPSTIRPGQQINLSVPATSKQAQPSLFALTQQTTPSIIDVPGHAPDFISENNSVGNKLKTEPKGLKLPYSERAVAQLEHPIKVLPMSSSTASSVPPKIKTDPATNNVAKTEIALSRPPSPVLPKKESDTKLSGANVDWMWPTSGELLASFSENSKGIKISGKSGQSILASAAGKVVYSGSGLRGYGKLIIIKHNSTFLSAYAHNREILVKEGDAVAKGQKIAEMGNTDTDGVKLHFEIRMNGSPVDPLKFLPNRSG